MYKILEPFKGSPDGMQVICYEAGQAVELEPELAKVALEEGWAEEIVRSAEPDDLLGGQDDDPADPPGSQDDK